MLEYLHVPHDLPLAPQHQLLLAQSKIKDKDLEEGTPDHPGEPLETAEVNGDSSRRETVERDPASPATPRVRWTMSCRRQQREPVSVAWTPESSPRPSAEAQVQACSLNKAARVSGTVVLDVEQGGIEVPSFVGKTVRGAMETAQDVGLQLEAVGSGVARQQTPTAGTHVPAGSRVTVQFGR